MHGGNNGVGVVIKLGRRSHKKVGFLESCTCKHMGEYEVVKANE